MRRLIQVGLTTSTSILVLLVSGSASNAASFNFFQGGYSEGAFITGTFTGKDLNMDGAMNSSDGEVTDYMVSFSGNSIIPAFSDSLFVLSDVLIYFLDSEIGDFFPEDGIADLIITPEDDYFYYSASGGTGILAPSSSPGGEVGNLISGAFDTTTSVTTVTPVHEPNAILALLGLGGLGLLQKRRQHDELSRGKIYNDSFP